MVAAVRDLIEFCYHVRRSIIDEDGLEQIDALVASFHRNREAFRDVRPNGFSLPRQHSITHYSEMIREFGAPNGLCSSITESKHIKAVKRPWRRSNRYEPLGQMLTTNERLDKLAAARIDFQRRGLLGGVADAPPVAVPDPGDSEGNDFEAVDDEAAIAEVRLSKTYGAQTSSSMSLLEKVSHLSPQLVTFLGKYRSLQHISTSQIFLFLPRNSFIPVSIQTTTLRTTLTTSHI